jgi:hypothetical protein
LNYQQQVIYNDSKITTDENFKPIQMSFYLVVAERFGGSELELEIEAWSTRVTWLPEASTPGRELCCVGLRLMTIGDRMIFWAGSLVRSFGLLDATILSPQMQ